MYIQLKTYKNNLPYLIAFKVIKSAFCTRNLSIIRTSSLENVIFFVKSSLVLIIVRRYT